jgi:methyl-accepting chemotaxis protein
MSSTAEELSSQAEQLQSTISFFKTDELGSASAARYAAPGKFNTTPHRIAAPHFSAKRKEGQRGDAAKHSGIALNLKQEPRRGNGDAQDEEFEKF